MKTSFRLLVLGAMAIAQWWSATVPQPLAHTVDAMVRQVSKPDALANVFMRLEFIARCVRRAS